MRTQWLAAVVMCLAASCLAADSSAQPAKSSEKLRILVDKVMEGNLPPEESVQAAAEAGFNVFTPRRAGEDEQTLRRVAHAAQKHGIHTVAWMWGTKRADSGLRLVLASGQEARVFSPNADELWAAWTELILMHARVSKDCPALLGSFLDMEIYDDAKAGWAYPLSYDEKILGEFATAAKLTIPKLELAERQKWLVDNKQHEAFEKFQIDSWRRRCRKLRRQVDEINPRFQFWIYPGPNSQFINEAAGPEWSKGDAPMLFADLETYSRPGWFSSKGQPPSQAASLAYNQKLLEKDQALIKTFTFPSRYVGGIDPAVRGADPEFCAANAIQEAQLTDGYWVFYEGPRYDKPDHAAYWTAFRRANHAIQAGNFDAAKQPRLTQDFHAGAKIAPKTNKAQLGVYGLDSATIKWLEKTGRFEIHLLEDTTAEYLNPLDAVILQNYSYNVWDCRYYSSDFVAFAKSGKGLLACGDTMVQCEKLLPEVGRVERLTAGADRYGLAKDAVITVTDAAAIGMNADAKPFRPYPVWTFRAKGGSVVAVDGNKHPVCLAAPLDAGRVACYGGPLTPCSEESERAFLLALIEYVAKQKG